MSFADVARFRAVSSGTGDFVVSAAITGYQTPASASVVNTAVYSYRAESDDLSQWEAGQGAYTVGSTTLARTKVLFNSSGTTSKISFSAAPQVALTALAEDIPSIIALGANGIQINGSMNVSQENGGNSVSLASGASKYLVDGWNGIYTHVANTAVFAEQQVAPPGSPSFGIGFQNAFQLNSTTALSSPGVGDFAIIQTPIEGYRSASLGFGNATATLFTVSFWVYATIAGTATVGIRNSALNRSYVVNFTINNATTWEYKTVIIPADATGTWLQTNGVGIRLSFAFACGSNFQGTNATWAASNVFGTSSTTNFFASNNNVVCVTGVTVLPGTSIITEGMSPFLMRPYMAELELCKRYYRKSFPQATAPAQNAGVAGAICIKNPIALGDPSVYVPFAPVMCSTPTITTYNPSASNANWRDITAASDVTVSVDPATAKSDAGFLIATSGTVTTLGDILGIHYTADARL